VTTSIRFLKRLSKNELEYLYIDKYTQRFAILSFERVANHIWVFLAKMVACIVAEVVTSSGKWSEALLVLQVNGHSYCLNKSEKKEVIIVSSPMDE
jgi:hypothetical protein